MLLKLPENRKERVEKIKSALLNVPPGICSERARCYSITYRENGYDPPIILRAKALKSYLVNKTIYIDDDTLIPGFQSSHPRWAPIFPEYSWKWLYEELDTLQKRKYDRFIVSDGVKKELLDLLPEWKGKTLFEGISARQPDFVKKASEMGVTSWTGQATSGEGHIVLDFQCALREGFSGIKNRVINLKNQLKLYEPQDLSKNDFYEASGIVLEGVVEFLKRVENIVNEKARGLKNIQRKQELISISEMCKNVQLNPPSNFREALFVVWILQLIQQIESNGHSVSLGRLDQYLYPYYEKDIKRGHITQEDALELIEHFYLKLFSIVKIRPEKHTRTVSGYPMFQNLVISGQTREGFDATNELSYICLSALAEVRLSEPNFYIRIHENTPGELLEDAINVVKMGFGMPAFVNDKIVIPSLLKRGVSRDDAYDYSTMGCLEVQVPGKWGYRANGKSKVNVLKILELALNNGTDPNTGFQLQKGDGDLTKMQEFDDLLKAWRKQLRFYTEVHVAADNINDKALGEMVPNAFASTFVQDCLKRGKHINEGGAIYDMTSGALVGVPNVGNGLAAIKKLVFEEKSLSKDQLKRTLASNFTNEEGNEIYCRLLNKVPKYGEDDDYVDDLVRMVIDDYEKIICNFKNMRHGKGPIGGGYYPSTVTISQNVPSGAYIGATPDGRKDGEPTADGISPSQGTGKLGPTAVLRSVSKLPTLYMTGGQLLNLRITHDSLEARGGVEKLAALLRAFFKMDGWHVQLNTVSTGTLRDALQKPDKYQDMVVRVAGYSALFVSLDPTLQQDIISRLEHNIN